MTDKKLTLNQKLIKIQNELKAPKGQYNNFGGYKYRSCEDIMEALKPLLLKHDCTLTLWDDMVDVADRVYVKATAQLTDGQNVISTNSYAREEEAKKGMDASQITGAASSYARKYALNGLFLIDDTKDADSNEQQSQDFKAKPKAKKKDTLPYSIADQNRDADMILTQLNKIANLEDYIKFKENTVMPIFSKLKQAGNSAAVQQVSVAMASKKNKLEGGQDE